MLKRFFAIFMSTILIAVMAISLVGCGPEESEAKALVKDLVSRSEELNEIYFGKGLRYKDTGNSNDVYLPVDEKEKYTQKSKLVTATRKVFSSDYASSIINMAFNGVQSEINQNSVISRYMVMSDESNYDILYVNKSYEPLVNKLPEYDFDTIVITKTSSRFVEATIEAMVEVTEQTETGPVTQMKKMTIDVTLVLEDDGWRLDSATC